MNSKIIPYSAAIIMAALLIYSSLRYKNTVQYYKNLATVTIKIDTLKDTIRVITEGNIKYKNKYVLKKDTIYIKDTNQFNPYVQLDTSISYDTLHVTYEFPPSNQWNVTWTRQPVINTITRLTHDTTKIYIRPARRWFERFDIGPTASVGLGTRGFDIYLGIGIQYGLW